MNDQKIAAAKALEPLLERFDRINGLPLKAVSKLDAAGGGTDATFLDFGEVSLVIQADASDDTIEFWVQETEPLSNLHSDASKIRPWRSFLGQPFGWGWIAINQQGYPDSVLLSFGGITPRIILTVVASSLKESIISDSF
jgi:hypothetical protein